MKKYILCLLSSSLASGIIIPDDLTYVTIDELLSADQDSNSKNALALLEKIKKVELVSDIVDLDKKAISYDDVVKATQNVIEKKTPKKTQAMWENIIAISVNHDISPTDEVEGLTFMDRRKNYERFTEIFAKIANVKDQIKKDDTDNKKETDSQDDKTKLNTMILHADVDLD
jgi:hypothetical protein